MGAGAEVAKMDSGRSECGRSLSPGRVKTWKFAVYIATPQATGVREESALGASLLRMLGMP